MSEQVELLDIADDWAGERLDKALAEELEDLSRSQVQALIREGHVTVNARLQKASYRLENGDRIVVRVPRTDDDLPPQPEAIPLNVLYEDEQVAVIDKPAGMVVHPAYGHNSGTLVNAVIARWPQTMKFPDVDRAGIVHRLDKETSGVIIIAKTVEALEDLREQFKSRTVHKQYLALVEGNPVNAEGRIDAPIGRDPRRRKQMAVVRDGREAVTEFRVIENYALHSLLAVRPETGRTHQIRVHLAFIDHPVVGDTVYGRRKQTIKMKRHFLHAERITFLSPGVGETVTAAAPLPVGLRAILEKLPR